MRYQPVLDLQFGAVSLSVHSAALLVGLAAGVVVARRRLAPTLHTSAFDRLAIVVLGSAFVGAKVGALMFDPADASWREAFSLADGFALAGGLVVATGVGFVWSRRHLLDVRAVAHAAAPAALTAIAIARIGDVMSADELGKPTGFVLGYVCPQPPTRTLSACVAGPGNAVHLTCAYDLVLVTLLLGAFLVTGRVLVVPIGYAVGRFVEDFTRVDPRALGLTGAQWLCVAVLVLASLVAWRDHDRREAPEAVVGDRR